MSIYNRLLSKYPTYKETTELPMDSVQKVCLLTLFVVSFTLLVTLWGRRRRTNADETQSAPEPAGAWPLIGHLPLLFEPNLAHTTLGALADKYGPAFTIRLGLGKALVISSREVAMECFTTNDKVFASRPTSTAGRIMAYNNAVFGLAPYGDYWREARKLVIIELLSNHRLELLKHVRLSEANTGISELYKACQPNALVELKQWFSDLSLNTIVRLIAGKRYFGSGVESDDGEGKRFQIAMKEFFHLAGLFVLGDAIPWLGWLDFQGYEKAMKKTAKEMDTVLEGWLENHRQNKQNGGAEMHQDFVHVMMSILEDNEFHGYDADDVLKGISLQLIFGGADTTLVTLTWAVSLLLNNRTILKKAQDEIDANVGKEKQVDESDIGKLVYLQAIIKETLRLYPAAPLSVQHQAMEDCMVAGYHVPKGTALITNLWKIHRDPSIWSDPSEFKPERFLGTHANVDVRGKQYEYLPFGSGRRSCPGISLALQMILLVLARLLHGFDLETPANAPVDMTESAGLTNLKATPLDVLITPRLPSYLY